MARRIRLPRRLSASLALTLALGLTIGPVGWDALAQDSQTEPQSENTDSQSVEDIIRDLERSDPVVPLTPPTATGRTTESPVSTGELIAEGTYVVNRLGRVVRSDVGGEWMFVFEADRNGQEDAPMALMPCRTLERLEQTISAEGDRTKVLISGQVFVYHGRNYLLPTIFRIPYERTNLSP